LVVLALALLLSRRVAFERDLDQAADLGSQASDVDLLRPRGAACLAGKDQKRDSRLAETCTREEDKGDQ
jgi:hypothetical protein